MENDTRKIELLNSILFSLPGTPIIYYGDEIGMGDNIWLKDRDGVRTPMQWNAGINAGFSTASPGNLYEPLIEDAVYGYQQVNVEQQLHDPGSLWNNLRHLIEIRKHNPAFQCGNYEILPLENHSVLVIVRSCIEGSIIAVHNLSDQKQSIHLNVMRWHGFGLKELLSGQDYSTVTEGGFPLELEPCQYLWLELQPQAASGLGQA
jgi:maltose alpha-D-glucosyltransferase/alpha-amylase